jgi:ArsR family transcriptional regulator
MLGNERRLAGVMDRKIYEIHAEMCKVFTSPTRIELIFLLEGGRKCVSELIELTGLNQPNISQHLQLMKDKKIVKTEKEGNRVFYTLTNPKISEAFEIIREILEEQLSESKKLLNPRNKRRERVI